ncbi:mechanosensitive ion channel domain-containing protein [Motiliproteus sp.]|uniref:mechanosensitive ion channel domain-containing protein n=1 Tax=Motiliproteus sp. TaxID=1898955 RepID=UPI003BA8CF47
MFDSIIGYQFSTTIGWIVGYIIVSKITSRILGVAATNKEVPSKRTFYINAYFRFLLVITFVIGLALIWSIDFRGLLVFASSLFAVVGVALFAQWSILSNITASVVIFFSVPHRIGDRIKILDGDDSITATIADITLFQIILQDDEGHQVSYPNNLILQRPIVRLGRLKETDHSCGSDEQGIRPQPFD